MSGSSKIVESHEYNPWEDEAAHLLAGARTDLAEQRARLKELEKVLNLLPDAVVVINSEYKVELFNPAAEQLFGKETTALKLETWELLLEDGTTPYPDFQALMARVFAGETVEEILRLNRPGTLDPPWIEILAQPLELEEGKLPAAMLRIQDISQLKQNQQNELHVETYRDLLLRFTNDLASASDSLDDVLANTAHFAATILGDACVLAMVSDAGQSLEVRAFHHTSPDAQALLHYSLTAFKFDSAEGIAGRVLKSGKPLLLPSIPDDLAGVITPLERSDYVRRFGISSLVIVPIIVRREVIGILECSCERGGKTPYTLEDQSLLTEIAERGALAIDRARLRDSLRANVNQLVTTQKALQANEARFQTIFNASPTGIMLLDIDGRLLQYNSRLCEILGFTPQDLNARFLTDFIHGQTVIHFESALRKFQTDANPQQLVLLLKRKDDRLIWAELNLGTVKNAKGEIEQIVGILSDISARKQMEAEIQEMNHQLLESLERERLQLALELHDGPMQELHSVTYQLENLHQLLGDASPRLIFGIKESVLQTIQNLRKTAKELRPPALMDFGLEKAIRSYAEEFHEKYPDLAIHLDLASDHNLLPDNVRLALFRITQQAMMNIVRHAQAKEVSVHFTFDAEEIELDIQDDGRGFAIPEHWIQFVRQGHYGLAGSAERVQAFGGEFRVISAPAQGTRITIRIPRPLSEILEQPPDTASKIG